MVKDVFDFRSYKRYLSEILKNQPANGHGYKSRLAQAAGCRVAYVSQIFGGEAHFSPEQAEALNTFLGHSPEEADYFLLLVQLERAGSKALEKRIEVQIEKALEKRLILKDRVDIKASLSPVDQATYYSAWYFAATHILVTIPSFQTREAIGRYLDFPVERTNEILDFLVNVGLVNYAQGRYTPGTTRLFLGNDSPMIAKHHSNWRMRAIQSLDRGLKTDLHFSGVFSLARADVLKIKEKLVKDIEEARSLIRESKDETELQCFAVDFFKI